MYENAYIVDSQTQSSNHVYLRVVSFLQRNETSHLYSENS
jgi:hypothetical protein